MTSGIGGNGHQRAPSSKAPQKGHGKKKQARVLFDKSQLKTRWEFSRGVGPGLVNVRGASCFLNAVLECLTYTPPLAQFLLSGVHGKKCTLRGFCAMCSMEKHVNRCMRGAKSSIRGAAILPGYFTANLRDICKEMRLGRQQDAHEFYAHLMEAMHKSTIHQLGKLEPKVEWTAFVYQIFGGVWQSQVRCLSCKSASNNLEAFRDLGVDIGHAKTLVDALKNTFRPEKIQDYRCDHCKQTGTCSKRAMIRRLPIMLSIHLKRFTYDRRKNNAVLSYPLNLDMAPYHVSSGNATPSTRYSLYAVLVHFGYGCDSGHYIAYIKAPNGEWYCMDDEEVRRVSLKQVLSERAYLLFYAQQEDTAVSPPSQPTSTVGAVKRPAEDLEVTAKRHRATDSVEDPPSPPVVTETVTLATEQVEAETAAETEVEEEYVLDISSHPGLFNRWVVRPASHPFRSLRGDVSPCTFGAAVSDESRWTVLPAAEPVPSHTDASKTWRQNVSAWLVQDQSSSN